MVFSLIGASFLLTIVGGTRCSSISKHFSAICGRVAVRGMPKSDLGLALGNLAVHRQLDRTDFTVQIQRIIENNDRKFLLRAEMFDDRGDIVIRRIDFLGDVNHLARQLPFTVGNESS